MLGGSMVALITPMHEDGGIDLEAIRRLIDFHIDQGSDAIVAVGTTGESATLNEQDHCALLRQVVAYADGRISIIAGTGANSTTEAIDLTRCAREAGADACLLVTPYYNKPTQEGLYLHYLAVSQAVDIPQILYNVPGRTACDMLPETVARLALVPNIIGIKEATGELDRAKRIRELCGPDFLVFSGDDATARELILRGAHGVISVTANVAPRQMHDMCVAAQTGDQELAERIDAPLSALHRNLFVESNPIPVKWAVSEMGLCERGIRLPLTWLSEPAQIIVREAMRIAGIK